MDYSVWSERELIEELERRYAILPALRILMHKIDRHVLYATYQEDTWKAYAQVKEWMDSNEPQTHGCCNLPSPDIDHADGTCPNV